MKSDWTQEFREKFEGYRPDIPIPPFAIRTRRGRKTVYWIATAAVAATVTAVFYLAGSYTYNKGQIQAGHLIGEASAVIRSAFCPSASSNAVIVSIPGLYATFPTFW